MNLKILDSDNMAHFLQMGCYGIGVSRIIAAAIEQNHDDAGIIWPKSIAPFEAVVVEIDAHKNETIRKFSSHVYDKLKQSGLDVILDDRVSKLGNKLNDWELIGIPNIVIIGKTESDKSTVTFKTRGSSDKNSINLDKLINLLSN